LIASKGFTAVRVYSTDCGALETIPAACAAHGINLILGIFINESGIGGAQTQVDAILAWGKFDMVDLVVVGNEALFTTPPRASAGDLANFINTVKGALRSKGYKGPVTTAEPLNIWQANAGALCDAIDVVGLNIHPFFNADCEASGAGAFAKGQLEIAAALCPGKDAYNLETGWPSSADRCNGKACAGASEQAAAIKSIMAEIGGKSVMFSFKDDKWKKPGAFGAEQFWGTIQLY
jgi:exo-beta-1,3-glucanase (GH17 family)